MKFDLNSHKHLRILSTLLLLSSLGLVFWIVYLSIALPSSYRAENWDIAWVGFDVGMLISLVVTSWALWNRRQIAIPGSIISATFLVIDVWFDIVTAHAGLDFNIALILGLIIEVPAAVFLLSFSRRATRRSIHNSHVRAGAAPASLSLWKTPLTIFEDDVRS